MTGQPIEFPTSVAVSIPRSSMNCSGCVREARHVERLRRLHAAAEPREVGNERVELVLEQLGGRQQVPAREAEAVQVHHHRGVGRILRLPVEEVEAVDRGPAFGQRRRAAAWEASRGSRRASLDARELVAIADSLRKVQQRASQVNTLRAPSGRISPRPLSPSRPGALPCRDDESTASRTRVHRRIRRRPAGRNHRPTAPDQRAASTSGSARSRRSKVSNHSSGM